jgi:hypothetical protein
VGKRDLLCLPYLRSIISLVGFEVLTAVSMKTAIFIISLAKSRELFCVPGVGWSYFEMTASRGASAEKIVS